MTPDQILSIVLLTVAVGAVYVGLEGYLLAASFTQAFVNLLPAFAIAAVALGVAYVVL